MTSGLNQSGCQNPGATSSSSSLTSIIGGTVGGILLALIIIVAGYWYFRRKQTRKAEAAHRQELNSADYRLADGTAPRITPFILGKQKYPDEYSMIPSGSEHSPFRDDGLPQDSVSSSHQPHPSQQPLPPLSAYANTTSFTSSSPPSDANTHSGYASYDSNVSGEFSDSADIIANGTDARTGLANPDAFSYRTEDRRYQT